MCLLSSAAIDRRLRRKHASNSESISHYAHLCLWTLRPAHIFRNSNFPMKVELLRKSTVFLHMAQMFLHVCVWIWHVHVLDVNTVNNCWHVIPGSSRGRHTRSYPQTNRQVHWILLLKRKHNPLITHQAKLLPELWSFFHLSETRWNVPKANIGVFRLRIEKNCSNKNAVLLL